ncbi:NAD(P)H-hydrate epimerase [Thiogranum longum]|uniref:Bifunctional NAD(P)H-hydrate repair enzyme n=1 Tax=Thiogranum longum TaxID=1537524 RepID=A0A4R1HI17_9GAMM|nr:NAD(P)H-hydrate dehydratase [Thiogranum longum]TCK19059.1 NAD(P)H-hydrate epimerase [Thiogranum longum]
MTESGALPLYTAAGVRELDRLAIEGEGIAGYTLMCRAGQALFNSIATNWPACTQINILCGAGNNGGDGYVLARLLREAERAVSVQYLGDPGLLKGDAAKAFTDFTAAGGEATAFEGELIAASLHVDAMLGTGLTRVVEGRWRQAIEVLNARSAPVLAVDIPSGLDADSGDICGIAVRAQRTLTFIGRKRGLYTARGVDCTGAVDFSDLDVPAAVYERQPAHACLLQQPPLGPLALPRARSSHKGDFGYVLVVGGGAGMPGAPRLAAEAAARCGAGLVSVATHRDNANGLNAGRWEFMVRAVMHTDELAPLLQHASVVVIGPGLGQSPWSRQLLERVLETALPLVLDADALNLLARDPLKRDNWILTPHPGEAARLLGSSTKAIQQDRFSALESLRAKYGGTIVLKGAGTLIGDGGLPAICAAGNPGMASGGMGDVLSGVIGALLAQGLMAGDAARAAVCLHAQAADRAAAAGGERGLLAGDLMPLLREGLNGRT